MKLKRRKIVTLIMGITGFSVIALAVRQFFGHKDEMVNNGDFMILKRQPIDFQWPVQEPFLFCVHHLDHYPKGEGNFGPHPALLSGRDMGQDFDPANKFRMYHGEEVPGFPVHPHRGFETITVVRKGYVDHADSMGAAGRYGEGDVQWMTAGSGVQHSEMFPLLKADSDNTCELFQIWLNLPRRSKMVKPHFTMFWSEKIPKVSLADNAGEVEVIAGEFQGQGSLNPPPDSWAAEKQNEVSVLLVKLNKGSKFEMPKAQVNCNRSIYFYLDGSYSLNGSSQSGQKSFFVDSSVDLIIQADERPIEFLILQAKPIGEPIFQHGPFVMNTRNEIILTIEDYQRTHFGGWSWPRPDMVHGKKIERFAKYPDGKVEKPEAQS